MRHLFAVARATVIGIALLGAGCAKQMDELRQAYNVITDAKVSSKKIVLGIQSFDFAKISATGYYTLRGCNGANGPVCRDHDTMERMDAAIQEGTNARDELKAFVRANPDGFGSQSAYDKMEAATNTINAATAIYTAATRK